VGIAALDHAADVGDRVVPQGDDEQLLRAGHQAGCGHAPRTSHQRRRRPPRPQGVTGPRSCRWFAVCKAMLRRTTYAPPLAAAAPAHRHVAKSAGPGASTTAGGIRPTPAGTAAGSSRRRSARTCIPAVQPFPGIHPHPRPSARGGWRSGQARRMGYGLGC
jgi:hypothetical protein